MTLNVAILVSDNLLPDNKVRRDDIFELEEQMNKLVPAFASFGMGLDIVPWRDAAGKSSEYEGRYGVKRISDHLNREYRLIDLVQFFEHINIGRCFFCPK